MTKSRCFAVIILISLLVICVSCGNGTQDGSLNGISDFQKTDIATFVVNNSVCPLQYSAQWKDLVTATVLEHSGGCTVEFTAILEGQKIPLFTFVMSDTSDSGYLLGVLETDSGEKNVYLIDLFDKDMISLLSEEAAKQYSSMSYDVNVIISKLVYDNHMTLT